MYRNLKSEKELILRLKVADGAISEFDVLEMLKSLIDEDFENLMLACKSCDNNKTMRLCASFSAYFDVVNALFG